MEWEAQNFRRETPSGAQRHTNPSPLSTFNGPRRGLGVGAGVLKYSPARRAGGGAGPAGGRGLPARGGVSAALAGAHDHVGQLLHLGLAAHVVHNGQRLQSLRHAARRRRCSGVVLVVQGQDLRAGSGPGVTERVPPLRQPFPISLRLISPG